MPEAKIGTRVLAVKLTQSLPTTAQTPAYEPKIWQDIRRNTHRAPKAGNAIQSATIESIHDLLSGVES